MMRQCVVRDVQGTRALHGVGGTVDIGGSHFEGNLDGAIAAAAGSQVRIEHSFLVRNAAAEGGAISVVGTATKVVVVGTRIALNVASARGGGLHVAAGLLVLDNRTVLEGNRAPEVGRRGCNPMWWRLQPVLGFRNMCPSCSPTGPAYTPHVSQGATMQLSGGATSYVLPAPAGRWVNTTNPNPNPNPNTNPNPNPNPNPNQGALRRTMRHTLLCEARGLAFVRDHLVVAEYDSRGCSASRRASTRLLCFTLSGELRQVL